MSDSHGHGATPAPAGLVAFAMACWTFFSVYAGFVDGAKSYPLLACWMLGGFVIQLCVGLGELKHNNVLGGNVFLYFSGFFMLATAFSLIVKSTFPALLGIAVSAKIEGFAWLACTLCLVLWSPAYWRTSNFVMSILILTADIALVFLSFRDLEILGGANNLILPDPMVRGLIAWPLFISGACAIYITTAIQLGAAFGKQVLPLGKGFLVPKS